jgi:hypothetical protein
LLAVAESTWSNISEAFKLRSQSSENQKYSRKLVSKETAKNFVSQLILSFDCKVG